MSMNDNDIFQILCKELDQLLLDILLDMETYVQCKIDMEQAMNSGYVNIAKTRYIKGTASVSTMQLPTQHSNAIVPQVQVYRNMGMDGCTDSIEIVNNLLGEEKLSDGAKTRKRPEKLKTNDEISSNPIRLFGVLVPESLKLSQKSFINAVERAGTIATVQCCLGSKVKRYQKLLDIKQQLLCRNKNEE